MRTIIVYLAILALLLCPYHCAVRFAASQSLGNENDVACCQKCRERQLSGIPSSSGERSRSDHCPTQPAPSEDGKCCLCEGAVFNAATRSPAETVLESSLFSWVGDMALVQCAASFPLSVDRVTPPPNEESGRLTRIVIRSLLL